ncbi:MAG: heavy-metal-associated domain-containing protein [Chloroflexi bacterium]|nr:heavy-metal-associated domain-containing protein [Chloroflexota bacterium]
MDIISVQTPQESKCHVPRYSKHVDVNDLAHAYSAFLFVQGMGCPSCAMRVHNSLLELEGVLFVEVDLERALVHVLFNPSRAIVPSLASAVAAAGNDGRHHYTGQLLGVYEQHLE